MVQFWRVGVLDVATFDSSSTNSFKSGLGVSVAVSTKPDPWRRLKSLFEDLSGESCIGAVFPLWNRNLCSLDTVVARDLALLGDVDGEEDTDCDRSLLGSGRVLLFLDDGRRTSDSLAGGRSLVLNVCGRSESLPRKPPCDFLANLSAAIRSRNAECFPNKNKPK